VDFQRGERWAFLPLLNCANSSHHRRKILVEAAKYGLLNPEIARIYDLINPPAKDTNFYVSLAGSHPCNVLDLGCGTGTLCCALARNGHHVTGVDPSPAMLNVAKSKPYAEKIEWVQSCAQRYKSDRRFDLIVMTGHAFQVLLTDDDILAVLKTMHDHLNEHGKIGFEIRNPNLDWAAEWATRSQLLHTLPTGELIETLEIISQDSEFISFRTSYSSPQLTLSTNSTLRFPAREHVEALIARSGLVVRSVFGDWDAAAFSPDLSREIIFVAEVAG
jgi:SAM-dependent methyltransferase